MRAQEWENLIVADVYLFFIYFLKSYSLELN